MNQPRVASGAMIPYLKLAKDSGIDPQAPLSELGLTLEAINQKQTRIPMSVCSSLIGRLVELSRDSSFGLQSARYIEIGSYDINGYISVNCSCPLEAVELTTKYYGIISDQRVLYVSENQTHIISQWLLPDPLNTVNRNIADHLLASYVRFARSILGLQDGIAYASFRHPAPTDPQLMQLYEESFDCPLHFDQQHYSVAFDRQMARDMRIPQADTMLRDILVAHAESRLRDIRTTPPFTYEVKEQIRKMLEETVPSRECVAEKLHMGSRTLQRHLLSEGSSYKSAFNEVRHELALHYIKNKTLSLDDIA